MAGIAAHVVYWFFWTRYVDLRATAKPAQTHGLVDLLWISFGLVFLLVLFVAWYATTTLDGLGNLHHWLWYVHHFTSFGSFLLGLATGAVCAAWYRNAGRTGASNPMARGIAVGVLAAVVLFFGLNHEYRIFDRLNKFSASVISLEFDRTQLGEQPEVSASAPDISDLWVADGGIGFALFIVEDLAKHALRRDREALAHLQGAPAAALFEGNNVAFFGINRLELLRKAVHTIKRDRSSAYFDTYRLDQIALALAFRELVVAHIRLGARGYVASRCRGEPRRVGPARTAAGVRLFAGDVAASGHFDSSAQRLKAALADPVADRIVETLRMARQVGGTELTPVLRALAASVRADAALRAEVEARQSWIRGAAVLGVAAPWVILALLRCARRAREAYSSPEGVALILAGAAVSFVAYRVMLRIGRLPEPRRWFG